MAGVNMNRMRKHHDEQQKGGGDFLGFDKGETLLYILPPCRADDEDAPTEGLPYVPITVHYKVGKNDNMVASLDPEKNPILDHPFLKAFLKKQKKRLTGSCPVGESIDSGDLDDDEMDDMRPSTKYLWAVVVMGTRTSNRDDWSVPTPKVEIMMIGKQIYDGIMDVFFDNGDITDPAEAIFVKVKKEGKDRNTKYTVKVDSDTLKKAKKLPAAVRKMIDKAQEEGGEADLFQTAANLIKAPNEVTALLEGVPTADPDDEEDLDDEDEPAPKKKAKKKAKKKPAPPPEDDEDDEEEEDDEEDLDPPEDDEEEDDEEEEPEPPKKKTSKKTAKKTTKKTTKKKAKKKPAPPPEDDEDEDDEEEDDEDELGLEDLENELNDLDEDEDEEDDEEEDDEEEEPEPPKKKTSKKTRKKRPAKRS